MDGLNEFLNHDWEARACCAYALGLPFRLVG